jgi:molybdopterin-guanine dinucleotide biosynthesis protein A
MLKTSEIQGVILAGGKSKRIGKNKAFLTLNGKFFIIHSLEKLKEIFNDVIIISDEVDKFSFLGVKVFPDIIKDAGPLGGIYTALMNIEKDYAFIVPCDMPLLRVSAIKEIIKHASKNKIVIGFSENEIYPLLGIYPKKFKNDLKNYILKGGRKVMEFIESFKMVKKVDLSKFKEYLINVNTPSDYKLIEKKFFSTL